MHVTCEADFGLNPFDIRASVRTRPRLTSSPTCSRLNPFDIRASVRTLEHVTAEDRERLNPFDIRASVRTKEYGNGSILYVSIPLISGHQSGLTKSSTRRTRGGLNPFDIRASVRTTKLHLHWTTSLRLNPFDIRASVRTYRR